MKFVSGALVICDGHVEHIIPSKTTNALILTLKDKLQQASDHTEASEDKYKKLEAQYHIFTF